MGTLCFSCSLFVVRCWFFVFRYSWFAIRFWLFVGRCCLVEEASFANLVLVSHFTLHTSLFPAYGRADFVPVGCTYANLRFPAHRQAQAFAHA